MRISVNDLPQLISQHPELKMGCVVDTNAFFAATMPLDRLNAWAEEAFLHLRTLDIPTFTNINIRSEFLDLQRRVLVPEGLVTLHDTMIQAGKAMDLELRTQLRSLKTQKDGAATSNKLFKFNDQQMKKYRTIMQRIPVTQDTNAWDAFCRDFLHPFIKDVWDENIDTFDIQFIGTRGIESRQYFRSTPSWQDLTDIIGRFAIGSADAMIINFFLCSKFPLIVTGDEDVAYAVERLSGERYILVPEEHQ
jgi:hypothetical protein